MKRRVYLHVGTMKTGTTFIQTLLRANTDILAANGVIFPPEQTRAVREVLGLGGASGDSWDRLVASVEASGGTGLVSMEFLSYVGPQRSAAVLESLKAFEVHVVLTVRDTVSLLPSQWQTALLAGGQLSWDQYAGDIARGVEGSPAVASFDRAQKISRIMRAWADPLPADRVHVVTVPPSGSAPGELWRRFAGETGLEQLDLDDTKVKSNPSLGLESCEVLRRLNASLVDMDRYDRRWWARRLARTVLAPRRHDEGRPTISAEIVEFGAAHNRRVRKEVQRRGIDVVGSWSDLPEEPDHSRVTDERPLDAELLLGSARAAFAWIQRHPQAPRAVRRTDQDDPEALIAEVADVLRMSAHGIAQRS